MRIFTCLGRVAWGIGSKKFVSLEEWYPPSVGCPRIKVDGAARGQPGPTGIGGVTKTSTGHISFFIFSSKAAGVKDSNEVERMSISRDLTLWVSWIWRLSFRG